MSAEPTLAERRARHQLNAEGYCEWCAEWGCDANDAFTALEREQQARQAAEESLRLSRASAQAMAEHLDAIERALGLTANHGRRIADVAAEVVQARQAAEERAARSEEELAMYMDQYERDTEQISEMKTRGAALAGALGQYAKESNWVCQRNSADLADGDWLWVPGDVGWARARQALAGEA